MAAGAIKPGPSNSAQLHQQSFASSSSSPQVPAQCTFKLDEGYSEETRSQAGSDAALRADATMPNSAAQRELFANKLPGWIKDMPERDRSELAYSILRSLRTSEIASVVDRLTPLLHLDPVSYLPPELTFHIFSYLLPQSLLAASVTSRSWRERVLDPRLWKQLYRKQGWGFEAETVSRFQDELRGQHASKHSNRRSKMKQEDPDEDELRHSKQKARTQPASRFSQLPEAVKAWNPQHDIVEADENTPMGNDTAHVNDTDEMQDISYHTSAPASQSPQGIPSLFNNNNIITTSFNTPTPDEDEMYPSPPASSREIAPRSSFTSLISRIGKPADPLQINPSLITPLQFGLPQMNWHHLFKQRRKLEENWDKGRFVNFQLPHPDHSDEAHRECIYTIQYSRNYLVSGSRDRTVRIWDLNTRRLVRKPLEGHSASVLCLQFDESKDEDVIMSGSSDTHVIIWRFSTGEIIKKIERSHRESVLNLRFDKRYLVTCSKDRSIRVWSRTELEPGDNGYPYDANVAPQPTYNINMTGYPNLTAQPRVPKRHLPLPPYSLLKNLAGHSAAVNAIQLFGDEIVSASGDRSIKVWNLTTGVCVQTITGHTKGIACIQFDGRRIVSGSSDNTVRIFDKVTGAEVACLTGHANLVRTVQAGFGDLPGDGEDDEEEAREIDKRFFKAKILEDEENILMTSRPLRNHRRNNGSRNPNDIMAFGAKLPPGGGGSRFGRIVSGSYDETIIIWKRDEEGKWIDFHHLRQDTALRAAEDRNNAANPHLGGHHVAAIANLAHIQHQIVVQANQPPPPPGAPPPIQLPAGPAAFLIPAVQPNGQGQIPVINNPIGIHGGNGRVFKLQFDARMIICCSQDPRIVGWDFANGDEKIIEASRFFQGC